MINILKNPTKLWLDKGGYKWYNNKAVGRESEEKEGSEAEELFGSEERRDLRDKEAEPEKEF